MGVFDDIIEWFQNLGKTQEVSDLGLISSLRDMEAAEQKRMDNLIKSKAESYRPKDKTFTYEEEYKPIDDETLKQESDTYYSKQWQEEKNDIQNAFDEKIDKINSKEEKYKSDAEDKFNYYNDRYDDIMKNFKNFAVKNGVVDSSIVGSKNTAETDEKNKYIKLTQEKLDDLLNETANNKELAEKLKQKDIEELDLEFNKKVQDYFDKLKAKEQSKVQKVEDKNAQIAKEEKAYKNNQDKIVADKMQEFKEEKEKFLNNEKIYGYSGTRAEEYNNRLKLARDFYSKYPKKDALKAIEKNSDLVKLLGHNYSKLIEDIKNGK